jgi:two-component system, NtrC family, response regulator AtoC
MNVRCLVVDDEDLIRWSLRQKLEARGYQVEEAASATAACAAIEANGFDMVLLDYRLPDGDGIGVLRKLRERDPDAVPVLMTAHSTIESAVEAIKLGAFDYVPKPFQMEDLLRVIDKALETTRLRREVRDLRRQLGAEFGVHAIVGQHASMRRVLEIIGQVAPSAATTVFVSGETGTGKDMVARAIHGASDRAGRPFINITCTALSENLLESELFGHERGAFTDAKTTKKGLLELADGGTVFLDEIGDMAPGLQAKLLRFLEERKFRRVGGTQEISVDVRVIAATNRDIAKEIRDGRFREDLYYRLNVVSISLPPLRERGDDVLLLARSFADRFAREFKKSITDLDESAVRKLRGHTWPGNVRELRNAIERAVLLSRAPMLSGDDFALGGAESRASGPMRLEDFTLPEDGFDLKRLEALEAHLLTQALERTHHNQVRAAHLLNISRDRLRYRLLKYGLLTDAAVHEPASGE